MPDSTLAGSSINLDQNHHSPEGLGTGPEASYWAVLCLAIFSTLTMCLLVGYRREALAGLRPARSQSLYFHYGGLFPQVSLPMTSGRLLEPRSVLGKWTLLVLIDPSCEPCKDELQALQRAKNELDEHLSIIPVLSGRPYFQSNTVLAREYSKKHGLTFDFALDPGLRLSSLISDEYHEYPRSVLFDPDGICRLEVSGSQRTAGQSSALADGLLARFSGRRSASMPLTQWEKYAPMKDAPVEMNNGSRETLSHLSADRTLILTFLTGKSKQEIRRVAVLRRFALARGVRFLYVVSDRSAVQPSIIETENVFVTSRNTAPVFKTYGVSRGPVTAILRQGRSVIREESALEAGYALEESLAYAILLSQPKGAHEHY